MIPLASGVQRPIGDEVYVHLPDSAVNDSDSKEFLAYDKHEQSVVNRPKGRYLFDDIVFKSDFIRTFAVAKSLLDIRPGDCVLELGAAHGWASAIIKDDNPQAYVVASDIVPGALKQAGEVERMIGCKLDEKWAFSVRDIPFADAQFDRIFTFAAFHHFGDHGDYAQSLAEIGRILKPGGKLVLLYEPVSPPYLYKAAYKRANSLREIEGVDEDVLVVKTLSALAAQNAMTLIAKPFPIAEFRSSFAATLYYKLVGKLGIGNWVLSTTNLVFEKRG